MSAQILVVKPKALTAADKKLLRDAGIVVVEAAEPSSVRLLQPEGSVLGGDELLYAAMQAIAKEGYDCTRKHFVTTVAHLVELHVREPKA